MRGGALCLWAWCALAWANELRIVTLTPHATEMVFAAGAGDQIVGTVESSDFPASARAIARVGNGLDTSAEQVLALEPDWVVGWPSPLISQLRALGVPTFVSNPESLEAIRDEILALGQRFGTSRQAKDAAAELDHQLAKLDAMTPKASDTPIKAVVLASSDARFVIGRHTLMNHTLRRCGATNPFAATQAAAPQINLEGLMAAAPDVLITGEAPAQGQTMQIAFPLTVIDADSLYRPGPRFFEAAIAICKLIQEQNHTQHTDK